MDDDDKVWTAAAGIAALGAAQLTRQWIDKAWVKRRGKAPGNPLTDDTPWSEAIVFAAVTGVALGVVRLLAQRGVVAAHDRRKATLARRATV